MLTSIAVGLLCVSVPALFGWIVQVQGRVSITETKIEGLRELIAVRFDNLEKMLAEKHNENDRRLARIERTLNGSLYRGEDH